MTRQQLVLAAVAAAAVVALAGCGTGFKLPAEVKRVQETGNGTYARIDTWAGFAGVRDLLLTKSSNAQNEQLYVLFNSGPPLNSGGLVAYPLATPTPFSFVFNDIKNPVAVSGNSTRVYVLDQGDSCAAHGIRPRPGGTCDSLTVDFTKSWRVLEFFPDGGDTISSFTDTTMAWVQGIAVDDQQRIYVSGVYILVTVNPDNPFYYYRRFVWRVFRYIKGGTDPNMPGSRWHRDPNYAIEEGSGLGTASDPRGLDWNPVGGGALFIADTGNNRAQRRSDPVSTNDYLMIDGELGSMISPGDVSSDLDGYAYVIDSGHNAVYRFRGAGQGLGEYVQRVDIEPSRAGYPIADPVAVAADKDLVYVADRGRGEIGIFRRRK